ncbi:MAG: ABC transporter permease subunit [Pseudomonadota bacterium]
MTTADDITALPSRRPKPPSSGTRTRVVALRSASILLFFAVWYAVSLLNAHVWKAFNPILLPSPDAVLRTGIELTLSGELHQHILASLGRVLQGFVLAGLLGVVIGTAVGRSRTLEHLVDPMLELLRPIPPLAFLPMMVLWFGIGETSKIAFIAYAAFFPIFTTTVEGIKYVDPLLDPRRRQPGRLRARHLPLRRAARRRPTSSPACASASACRSSSSSPPSSSPPIPAWAI